MGMTSLCALLCLLPVVLQPACGGTVAIALQETLDELSRIAVDVFDGYIRSVQIPNLSQSSSKFSWRVSNIRVRDFTKPGSRVDLEGRNRLTWTLTNAGIRLSANWWAKKKVFLFIKPSADGTVDASANRVSLSLTVEIATDASGRPYIRVVGCTSSVGDVSISNIRGGGIIFNIANAIGDLDGRLERYLKGYLPDKLCSLLRGAVTSLNSQVQAQLQKLIDSGLVDAVTGDSGPSISPPLIPFPLPDTFPLPGPELPVFPGLGPGVAIP